MSKDKISDYSATANSNTDIGGINIDEGCAPSGINDAIRTLMKQLKDFQQGTSSDVFKGPLQVGAASSIEVTDNSNAALRITQLGTGNALLVQDEANPDSSPFVIDANGNVISGYTTALTSLSGITPSIQVAGANLNSSSIGAFNYSNTVNGAFLTFAKSRNGSIGSETVVQSGDNLLTIRAYGSDGVAPIQAAQIRVEVDGTPGTNDMPGRLVFSTATDASPSVVTEAMRINSTQEVIIGGTTALEAGGLSVQSTSGAAINIYRNDTSVSSGNALGTIRFYGNDTTSNTPIALAYIQGVASGTHAAGDNPTDLVLGTTPDGSASVTEAVRIKDGGGLEISRTAVTSPAAGDGNVFSGTYTPSQISVGGVPQNTNVASVSFNTCQYMRVGNTVTVAGQIAVDPTTIATDTTVKFSLPIASAFSSIRNLAGAGASITNVAYALTAVSFVADTINDCVEMRFNPAGSASNASYSFSFTYLVF